MKIHLVIPCYQPARAQDWEKLAAWVQSFKKNLGNDELSWRVIDDGSPRWLAPAESLCIPLERRPKNHGKGAIIRQAALTMPSDADIFCFTDFDVPYDVRDLLLLCRGIGHGADLCVGDRSARKTRSVHAQRISRSFSHFIFRFFTRTLIIGGVRDSQCGLKAFAAPAARILARHSRMQGFAFDMEWIYMALKNSLCIRYYPVQISSAHQASRLRSFLNLRFLKDLGIFFKGILQKAYSPSEILDWVAGRRESFLK